MSVPHHDPSAATERVLQRFERLVAGPYPDDDLRYGWEPLDLQRFFDVMSAVRSQRQQQTHASGTDGRFLDVGCGIGTKLALAYLLGWEDVTGVELRPQYADVARQVCPEAKVEVCDALDFQRYGEFDIVYCYHPFIAEADQAGLRQRIQAQLKPGATFVEL